MKKRTRKGQRDKATNKSKLVIYRRNRRRKKANEISWWEWQYEKNKSDGFMNMNNRWHDG